MHCCALTNARGTKTQTLHERLSHTGLLAGQAQALEPSRSQVAPHSFLQVPFLHMWVVAGHEQVPQGALVSQTACGRVHALQKRYSSRGLDFRRH